MPTLFDAAGLIPLLPLVAFIVIALLAHRKRAWSQTLALYTMASAFALAMAALISAALEARRLPFHLTLSDAWISLNNSSTPLGLYIDPLSAALTSALTLIGLLIFITNKDELANDPRAGRFWASLSLFAAGAFGSLLADNLLFLLIGWELMDIALCLLISLRGEARFRAAALKAFLTTQIGNVLLLIGIALAYAHIGSLAYDDTLSAESLDILTRAGFLGGSFPAAAGIALLIAGGAAVRSAQFPLHTWLAEAHEAPAQSGAFVHIAATASGAFVLLRIFPLLQAARDSLLLPNLGITVIALAGAVTALVAALFAAAQRDLRRAISLLAISQTGNVIAAIGMGEYTSGAFLLLINIFNQTLLLLAAGSVVRGMRIGDETEADAPASERTDLLAMGGLYSRQNATFWAFFVGALSVVGLPPALVSSFWSNNALLAHIWKQNRAMFWLLALAAGILTFGVVRLLCLIFVGAPRSSAAASAQESPPALITPLALLIVFAMGLGWMGIPEDLPIIGGLVPNWIAVFLGTNDLAWGFAWDLLTLQLAISVAGLVLAFSIYGWSPQRTGEIDRVEKALQCIRLGGLYRALREGFHLAAVYEAICSRGVLWLSSAANKLEQALGHATDRLAQVAQRAAQGCGWLDGRILAPAPRWIGHLGEQAAQGTDLFDRRMALLGDLAATGALALTRWSAAVERGLDLVVDSVGRAIQTASLATRLRTGKVQRYLLIAAATIVLVAITLLLMEALPASR